MDIKIFLALFLTVTFILHGIAFTILGFKRRKMHYFFLTGTFTLLTTIYFLKYEGWTLMIPGINLSAAFILRIAAILFTLAYLRGIYGEEGSWLWKLKRWIRPQ